MIIKGSARGATTTDIEKLAKHLLSAENEDVSILEFSGVTDTSLASALLEMRTLSLASRTMRSIYHASINLDRNEAPAITDQRWLEAADELQHRLGLDGHARVVVRHRKKNRDHVHIAFCRVHPETLKAGRDGHNYRVHEQTSRCLEARWHLRPVVGVHTRRPGTPRPVARATHDDWQAAERTGIRVDDVAAILSASWAATKDGRTFLKAIEARGLILARGRRGIVVVDSAGTPHSLPRRLHLKAADVQSRLRDIDQSRLPTVENIQKSRIAPKPKLKGNDIAMDTTQAFRASPGPSKRQRKSQSMAERENYWKSLGFTPELKFGALTVIFPNGTRLFDRGDEIALFRNGDPTDDEIKMMVAAGKSRGWTAIRLSGGTPEFQRRARLEALRQGYRAEDISLECEDSQSRPLSAAGPMPDHIRRTLAPPTPPVPADTPPQPAPAPETTPEPRL
ncbi:MAG: relaxase/mobilization nuclease domain-containing protein [Rhodospirillaceae bacterium]